MINDLSTPIRFLLFFLRVCMIGRGHELPRHTSGVPFNSWFLQRTSDFRIGWLKRHVSRTFTSEAQVRNLSENSGVTVLLYARYRIIARLRLLVSSAFSLLPFFIFCLGEGRARSTLHDFFFGVLYAPRDPGRISIFAGLFLRVFLFVSAAELARIRCNKNDEQRECWSLLYAR